MTAAKNAKLEIGFCPAATVLKNKGRPPLSNSLSEERLRGGVPKGTIKKLIKRQTESLEAYGGIRGRERTEVGRTCAIKKLGLYLWIGQREERSGVGRTREIKKLESYKNYIIKKAGITLTE